MNSVRWDRETGGVLLAPAFPTGMADVVVGAPRPVFWEELDLLGLTDIWKYPKSKQPLLWAVERRYYYRGDPVLDVHGGGMTSAPTLEFLGQRKLKLAPIDVAATLERNSAALETLENEAMEFVLKTYRRFRKRVDYTVVAFSGGKDSQVILDVVSRALHPDQYLVVFTDTTMELPVTLDTVKEVQEQYKARFPGLTFLTARHERPALELWSEFGPPSRMHRWCCSVYKSAPVVRLLQDRKGDGTQARVLLFDGVRADESQRRSSYARVTAGGKSFTQTNASIIQAWNSTEIFLHILRRSLSLNPGYRQGLSRVGCVVCPFSSSNTERVISQAWPEVLLEYRKVLETFAATQGVSGPAIGTYLNNGDWKKRAGGAGIDSRGSRVDFTTRSGGLEAVVRGCPPDDVIEWLKAVGILTVGEWRDGTRRGLIAATTRSTDFFQERLNDSFSSRIVFDDLVREPALLALVEKALTKTAYCVQCGVCTVQCPTGALTVTPRIHIDEGRCQHCGHCLTFTDKGCLRAKSLATSQPPEKASGGSTVDGYSGFSRYQTFGLRQEWLDGLMTHGVEWLASNSLGNRQRDSALIWFREAGLVEPAAKGGVYRFTELGELCRSHYITRPDVIWGVAFVNLAYGSGIVRWYVNEVPRGEYTRSDLYERLSATCGDNRSSRNGLAALLNFLRTTPIGTTYLMGVSHGIGQSSSFRKAGGASIPGAVVVYSLFRYAEQRRSSDFTVSQLLSEEAGGGPAREFGMSREALVAALRGIGAGAAASFVHVDLLGGLDNISLDRSLSAFSALQRFLGG